MSIAYRFFILSVFYCLSLTSSWSSIPDFTEDGRDLNARLHRNYITFQSDLARHSVYQSSKALTNPLMDYVLFLTSYSEDRNVALALDHLLKTGGPFGFSGRAADEQEKVFMAGAAQAIAQHHTELVGLDYKGFQSDHLKEIRRLQGLTITRGAVQHPYHPVIALPPSAEPLAENLKPDLDQSTRWQLFLNLLTDRAVPERQFAGRTLTGTAKADWANDILLCGCMMGVVPDVEKAPLLQVRGYLDDSWRQDNTWMETQHNYVQWRFPIHTVGMGGGIAPRYLEQTYQTLKAHPEILAEIQKMLRMSFARNVTFWGHKLTQLGVMRPLEADEIAVLGKAKFGKNWHENWIISTHNYLRMSRYLKCFYFFGLNEEKEEMYAYLRKTASTTEELKPSLSNHWLPAKGGKPCVGRNEGHIPRSILQ